jgi:tRNA dimethylallyltransferase
VLEKMFKKVTDLTESFLKKSPEGVIVILGATASGKTGLSVKLAHWLQDHLHQTVEIISVDSRQVYKDCDISSAKITANEMEGIRHHGIDIVDLETEYSVFDWQQYCLKTITEIKARGHVPMLAGGTMLWLDAVTQNYVFDEKGVKSDRRNEPLWPSLKIGLSWPREILYKRINQRATDQFKNGLIEETERVMKAYSNITKSAFTSFGYQEIEAYLKGLTTYEEALSKNQQRNRNYAKKQLTWWRGRVDVHWVEMSSV